MTSMMAEVFHEIEKRNKGIKNRSTSLKIYLREVILLFENI